MRGKVSEKSFEEALIKRAMLFEEFLANEDAAGRLDLPLKELPVQRVLLHGHCHQKAFGMMDSVVSTLSRIPNLDVTQIESGCCGMAGSFGYEASTTISRSRWPNWISCRPCEPAATTHGSWLTARAAAIRFFTPPAVRRGTLLACSTQRSQFSEAPNGLTTPCSDVQGWIMLGYGVRKWASWSWRR